jgi:hypothetical protein
MHCRTGEEHDLLRKAVQAEAAVETSGLIAYQPPSNYFSAA